MELKTMIKQHMAFAVLGAFVYSFVRFAVYQLAYMLYTTDFGIDLHLNFIKVFFILHGFEISIILALLGH